MTATLGGIVAVVATSLDAVVVGMDAGDQLVKPGRRGQFCNNAARPGRRRNETGLSGRRHCRRGCAIRS